MTPQAWTELVAGSNDLDTAAMLPVLREGRALQEAAAMMLSKAAVPESADTDGDGMVSEDEAAARQEQVPCVMCVMCVMCVIHDLLC